MLASVRGRFVGNAFEEFGENACVTGPDGDSEVAQIVSVDRQVGDRERRPGPKLGTDAPVEETQPGLALATSPSPATIREEQTKEIVQVLAPHAANPPANV